jgi:hypothetical protein
MSEPPVQLSQPIMFARTDEYHSAKSTLRGAGNVGKDQGDALGYYGSSLSGWNRVPGSEAAS